MNKNCHNAVSFTAPKHVLRGVLIFFMVLSACGGNHPAPPPSPIPVEIETEQPFPTKSPDVSRLEPLIFNFEVPDGNNSRVDTPPRTAIQFLIDESLSVIEECSTDKATSRHKIPQFFLNLWQELAKTEGDKLSSLSTGISLFSTRHEVQPQFWQDLDYNILLPHIPVNQLSDKQFYDQWHTPLFKDEIENATRNTYFLEGIQKVTAEFPKDADEKALVILTDGYFYDASSQAAKEVMKHLIDEVATNQKIKVYIHLLCSSESDQPAETSSVAAWKQLDRFPQVSTDDPITLMYVDDAKETIRTLLGLDIFSRFLPENSGWVAGGTNDDLELNIPGNAKVFFHAVNYSLDGSRDVVDQGLHFLTMEGKDVVELSVDPQCSPRKIKVIANPDDSGFYWYRLLEAEITGNVELRKSINHEAVIVKAHITPGNNFQELAEKSNLRSCYQAELKSSSADLNLKKEYEDKDCLDKEGFCYSGGSDLYASWSLEFPELMKPQLIGLDFLLRSSDGNTLVVLPLQVPLIFRAEFSHADVKFSQTDVKDVRQPESPYQDMVTLTLSFNFDVEPSTLHTFSSLTKESLETIGTQIIQATGENWTLCPNQINHQVGYKIEESSDPPSEDHIIVYGRAESGNNAIYTIKAFRYVLEQCGYQEIAFTWPDGDELAGKKHQCEVNLSDQFITCRAMQVFENR